MSVEGPAVLRPELRAHLQGSPRIGVREPLTDDLRESLRKASGGGPIFGVLGTLAHSPVVANRVAVLLAGLLVKTRVPAREREIVILRMGWRCGALYEVAGHIGIGLAAGLSEEEIGRITTSPEAAALPADDAALVRLADELYDANAVSGELWDALAARWSPEELVELVATAGAYWMVSNFLNAFRVKPEDGWPGWPRDVPPTGLR